MFFNIFVVRVNRNFLIPSCYRIIKNKHFNICFYINVHLIKVQYYKLLVLHYYVIRGINIGSNGLTLINDLSIFSHVSKIFLIRF